MWRIAYRAAFWIAEQSCRAHLRFQLSHAPMWWPAYRLVVFTRRRAYPEVAE